MKENDDIHLDELASLMDEDRKNLVITSLENIGLIKNDTMTVEIIENQKRLHDMIYEMYEIEKDKSDSIIHSLLIENFMLLEINRNLIELFILLKKTPENSKTIVKEVVEVGLDLTPQNSIDDIYTYLFENGKEDVEKSEINYQKVLKMKGDKYE